MLDDLAHIFILEQYCGAVHFIAVYCSGICAVPTGPDTLSHTVWAGFCVQLVAPFAQASDGRGEHIDGAGSAGE